MSDARWQRVDDLFHAAVDRDGTAREAFLRDACGDDAALYAEITSLVAAHDSEPEVAIDRLGEHMAADWASHAVKSDRAALIGRRVDRYQVVAHLGSGGMGEVYRATDSVLGRDVALKVLAPALHADVDFRRRLEKEARAASSLNHPTIVTVYEIGQAGSIDFVASELVDGLTLRARLDAGPPSLRELVDIGSQIGAALSTAHAAGIVHRDIKPENVMIRRDGIVKVVDFGLAKRTASRPADDPQSLGYAVTQEGIVAGTACYMSPEQALGEPLDHRSDLFSVGILLYEMATGQRPFTGSSDAALYDALLHASPPAPSTLRADLPVELDLVIGRALEKERDLRYQSAADLASDLRRLQRSSATAPLAVAPPRTAGRINRWRTVAVVTVLVAAALATALALSLSTRRAPADAATTRFLVGPPPNVRFATTGLVAASMTFAVSPDGRSVAYAAGPIGQPPRLWLRSLDSVEATAIDDTTGASFPFWSPDSRSVAFFTGALLKRKDLGGGAPRTLTNTVIPRGGTWSIDGTILYGSGQSGIFRVPADGGTPTPVTTPDVGQGEGWHRFPQFLPDGRHFLYLAGSNGSSGARTLYAGSLDDQAIKRRVMETTARASYVDPGYLLFVGNGDALMARPFAAGRLEFTGDAVQVGRQVTTSSQLDASYSVGGTTLAYAERPGAGSRLTWFDRSGQSDGTVGTPGQYLGVRLSPDGNTAAVSRVNPSENQPDIWLIDLQRGAETRVTFTPTLEMAPVWSPDGSRVLFAASPSLLQLQLFQQQVAGGGDASPVFKTEESVIPEDWSPDGQLVVYTITQPADNNGLMLLRMRDRRATPLVMTRFSEYQGRISPDGRWLAYTSQESGRPEVYLRPFPAGTSGTVISIGGGSEPSWRRDGRELFYLGPNGALIAVDLTLSTGIKASRPSELFRWNVPVDRQFNATHYAPTPDGRRFLAVAAIGDAPPAAITMVLNWATALPH
jgi:serine/threonine protein kinase